MSLSIIYPAFNEEKKISTDIINSANFLVKKNIEGEIIVVDDGSSDSTSEKVRSLQNAVGVKLILINHKENLGKGYAVRSGVLAAGEKFILYSDVGNIVPLEYAAKGINLLKKDQKIIVHASRSLQQSKIVKAQDIDRKISSWLFAKTVKIVFDLPNQITDTQCGFKLYNSNVAKKLYEKLETKGFLFEIEIILRAVMQGCKIIEIPVEWKCDRDSRITFQNTAPEVFKELIKLKKMFN